MPASSNFLMGKGKNAGGAITKKRFVKLDQTAADGETVIQCSVAGEAVFGVSLYSVTTDEINQGKGVSVMTEGRAIVEASVDIKVGEQVATTADGRARVATTGDVIAGTCDEPATAAGHECGVALATASGAISAGS